jgi:hypothetical protein
VCWMHTLYLNCKYFKVLDQFHNSVNEVHHLTYTINVLGSPQPSLSVDQYLREWPYMLMAIPNPFLHILP